MITNNPVTNKEKNVIYKIKNVMYKIYDFLNKYIYIQILIIIIEFLLNTDGVFDEIKNKRQLVIGTEIKKKKELFFICKLYNIFKDPKVGLVGVCFFLFSISFGKTTPLRCFLRIISNIFIMEKDTVIVMNLFIPILNILIIIGLIIYKIYYKTPNKLKSLLTLIFWGYFTNLIYDIFILILNSFGTLSKKRFLINFQKD